MPPAAADPANRPNGQTARDAFMRPLQTCRKFVFSQLYLTFRLFVGNGLDRSGRFAATAHLHGGVGSPRPTRQYNKNLSPRQPQTKKPCSLSTARECFVSLFRLNSTGGANALAGAAIDTGSSVDHSLVLHADCTDGASVNTCTASNALARNSMSHRDTPYLRADSSTLTGPARLLPGTAHGGHNPLCYKYSITNRRGMQVFPAGIFAARQSLSGSGALGARLPPRR